MDPRYFNVNQHTKTCDEHIVTEDIVNYYAVKNQRKDEAVASIFAWNIDKYRQTAAEKLEAIGVRI